MKKIIACISLAFAMSAGATALAATTATPVEDDSVRVESDAVYNTVLIEHSTSNEIVYVNQNDEGYNEAALNFLIKANPAQGTYNVTLGKADGTAPIETTFEIADTTPNVEIPKVYDGVNEAGDRVVGFSLKTSENLSSYTKLYFTATKGGETKSVCVDPGLPTITGSSNIDILVEVTGVPEGVTLTVGLSED